MKRSQSVVEFRTFANFLRWRASPGTGVSLDGSWRVFIASGALPDPVTLWV